MALEHGTENGVKRDPLWYKDAVFYELRVRSFYDSDGDGVGDFPGLAKKLDYLQALGVTTLWLLPFYPSPMRDDGYDIANYTDVHPECGTIPPTDTTGSSARASHRWVAHTAITTSGAIRPSATRRPASFFRTLSRPIGPGIAWPRRTTSIVSTHISPISTTTIQRYVARSCGWFPSGWVSELMACGWTQSPISTNGKEPAAKTCPRLTRFCAN